jgi:hypothetical protein
MRYAIEEMASGQFVIIDLAEGKLVKSKPPGGHAPGWPLEFDSREAARALVAEELETEQEAGGNGDRSTEQPTGLYRHPITGPIRRPGNQSWDHRFCTHEKTLPARTQCRNEVINPAEERADAFAARQAELRTRPRSQAANLEWTKFNP